MNQMPQLDGLRALCLLSIVIHHWTVHKVHLPIPFEMGAFVFFSLSGYLITRILLRGREKIAIGTTSLGHFMRSFTIRRLLRLMPAYLAALLLYCLILHSEVLENLLWYLTNSSNIHFAREGAWPGGADQFWTLAVDQQFYAFWPFLILFIPRRFLPYALMMIALMAPASRYIGYFGVPCFSGAMDDKLPWFLTDHLCMGALLAYLHESGRLPVKKWLYWGLGLSLTAYLILRYHLYPGELPSEVQTLQQTILAVCSTCIVGLCVRGFGGVGQAILEHPIIQYIGKRSYGYYVYHNLAMLLLGKVAFFLFPWNGGPDYFYLVRLAAGGYLLYLMAHYSWKHLEEPLMRRKERHRYQK